MSQVQTVISESRSVSEGVVEAVSEAEDVDPISLTPLYEVIDPDALDKLFASTPTDNQRGGTITFSYSGYEVTVASDGHISVAE